MVIVCGIAIVSSGMQSGHPINPILYLFRFEAWEICNCAIANLTVTRERTDFIVAGLLTASSFNLYGQSRSLIMIFVLCGDDDNYELIPSIL